ncbi:hypothetical protein EDD96_3742 [Streptomyces sp. Ag109_G2-6]|nr:hypothetical protein EDD96_3742 [Streptomyces sp. Ag109_G2-6]
MHCMHSTRSTLRSRFTRTLAGGLLSAGLLTISKTVSPTVTVTVK